MLDILGEIGRSAWGWTWAMVLAPVLLGQVSASLAQSSDGTGAPGRGAAEPIVLAADRVSYWDEGATRWVYLEGRASVLQSTEGLRAQSILARVTSKPPIYHVEASAEEKARLTGDLKPRGGPVWLERRTRGEVRILDHERKQVQKLKEAPKSLALHIRSFPGPSRVEGASSSAAAVAVPVAGFVAVPVASPVVSDVVPPVASPAPAAQPAVTPVQGVAQGDGKAGVPEEREGGGMDPKGDASVARAQFEAPSLPEASGSMESPLESMPPFGDAPALVMPEGESDVLVPPSELPPTVVEEGAESGLGPGRAPIQPNTRRIITIFPKDSGGLLTTDVKLEPDGRTMIFLRGGVNLIAEAPAQGIVDITADNAVIWTRMAPAQGAAPTTSSRLSLDPSQEIEIYLEGNVIFRQDSQKVAGNGDQKSVEAESFYIDLRTEWFLAEKAQLNLFDARFITPIKTYADQIRQYRPLMGNSGGQPLFGPTQIRADRTLLTGSRFPTPGYQFRSGSVELTQVDSQLVDRDGKPVANPNSPLSPRDTPWRVEARNSSFWIGPVPVFYWPRIVTETDDLDPPIRQIQFRANNYFGQQLMTDWSVFKIFGMRRPPWIDNWNLDVDYLSYRGLALGSELGWSGRDLWDNITDPFDRDRSALGTNRPYFGYFDVWGLDEHRFVDTLGTGPAVITNGPPGAGTRGFQRNSVPSFEDFRGRFLVRHMQSLLPSDAPADEDLRIQLEGAYVSDRHFLEQYYKSLFDTGLDQKTLGYFVYQRENRALTVLGSANLQDFYTDSQWLPRVEYRRLGDSLFNLLTWSQLWGADYANVHTDIMVNNPDIFAFQPFDPVSATSGPFASGRIYTAHELSLPINLDLIRINPYVQGQLVGWDNQYQTALPDLELNTVLPDQAFIRGPQGSMVGRAWGGAGIKANVMMWRAYPNVDSELMNLHGLNHKINFDANYRYAYSTLGLNRIGIQDELDDNTYEFVRRYFALINYHGGVLPPQYDPRLLALRRAISPIAGTTDIQDTIQTLELGIHQRLQTKRGPEGRRRIVDYMILDLTTTYFPMADRDNFGQAFGQNMYNWEWYVGDRTSLISYGWFESFDITGSPILNSNPRGTNDPFNMLTVTNGVSINRPPRGNVFIGYSVINTGPIATSALNVAYSYWLSPKWYSSFGTSYDFGNAILLGSTVGITRIGADFLTSIGLSVDPQRDSYMFGFELTPRLSPSIRFGSGGGIARFDSRYAPQQ